MKNLLQRYYDKPNPILKSEELLFELFTNADDRGLFNGIDNDIINEILENWLKIIQKYD